MDSREYYAAKSTNDGYFADRRENPYRSTVAFETFAERSGFFSTLREGSVVADVACGTGSETAYLAARYPHLTFVGIDLDQHFVNAARERHGDLPNLSFAQGDLYALEKLERWPTVRGVWLSQTLSWLPWWRDAICALLGPQVDRIALSTLAWEGPNESEVVHYFGRREDPETERVFYNVYSIPAIRAYMEGCGFGNQAVEEFEIDIDLKAPEHESIGSYTVRTSTGRRLTFSTWQYLPWHFFMFSR